ncbi:putative nucleotidyltransferase, ribonuclease H, partial [Tanacetum coccineum]
MRVRGYVGKQPLHILIDCGSTHNFLDVFAAKKLPCQLTPTIPLRVDVANGSKMVSSSEWGCDMVLGIQWLSTLGYINRNLKNLTMKFNYQGNKIMLRGSQNESLQLIQGKQVIIKGQWKQAQLALMIVCVYPAQLMQIQREAADTSDNNLPIQHLLSTCADVFVVPTELPPQRTKDHAITLIPNTLPITVRPYRLPPNQKDVVEQMVKELLDVVVIKENYRHLNKFIVKDNFPIHVVEELIDELCGAHIFSKLGLRSGYHQIRMKEADVYKITFRTHQGHYEFLFVIVFFDDILIYSANEEERLQHLQPVLEVIRVNTLYAKHRKCTFLVPQVEYLGHVLSAQGVATDPLKIQTMASWLIPTTLKQLRGFLGLTSYYRRFIKNYVIISQPLTKLLRKNGFHWSIEAEVAFNQLKQEMMSTPVLALPKFKKEFMVKTDASGSGIGAFLHQEGHPIAYLIKALSPRHQALSTYEKEFLAVMMALD